MAAMAGSAILPLCPVEMALTPPLEAPAEASAACLFQDNRAGMALLALTAHPGYRRLQAHIPVRLLELAAAAAAVAAAAIKLWAAAAAARVALADLHLVVQATAPLPSRAS